MLRRHLLSGLLLLLPVAAQDLTPQLWRDAEPVYRRILHHPFITGLTDGTLPRDAFQFYLIQDSLYLRRFSQALNTLAAKAPRAEWAAVLSRHSIEAMEEERQMHEKILASYGVTPAMIAKAEMAPVNAAYTNHLLATVEREPFTVGLAAMLPCYWIYLEVGRELVSQGSKNPDYQRWISQYAGDDYAKSVKQVQNILNEAGRSSDPSDLRTARAVYVRSSRYEWMFWDMAWRKETWPPN